MYLSDQMTRIFWCTWRLACAPVSDVLPEHPLSPSDLQGSSRQCDNKWAGLAANVPSCGNFHTHLDLTLLY